MLFPGGLESTTSGKDIILMLNSVTVKTSVNGKLKDYVIPPVLKNPEKGIADLIGRDLAKELFERRKEILGKLQKKDDKWTPNVEANERAKQVLESHKRGVVDILGGQRADKYFEDHKRIAQELRKVEDRRSPNTGVHKEIKQLLNLLPGEPLLTDKQKKFQELSSVLRTEDKSFVSRIQQETKDGLSKPGM